MTSQTSYKEKMPKNKRYNEDVTKYKHKGVFPANDSDGLCELVNEK